MWPRTKKEAPYGTATHCILRVQLRRVPRVPCRSARQRRTAAACSALFRARAPASAWPDGLCRLPQRCSGRVLRRVRHAHMRRGARPCTLCRMRRISLRHCEKKAYPAAAQAARRWTPCAETACAVAVRPAAFLCKKRRLHRARQHRKARLFCGRYQVTAVGIARGLRRPCWGVFSGMRRKTKAFTGPRHTGPASVFYN